MAGSAERFEQIQRAEAITYTALTPNMQGFEAAMTASVEEFVVFAAASQSFSKKIHCLISESLKRFEPLMDAAQQQGVRVRGYVSCVLGCPYEGEIAPEQVRSVAQALYNMGCYEISLGDTIGVSTPHKAAALFAEAAKDIPRTQLAGHLHGTYGQALANIYASLSEGIAVFDSSVAGLGGCPYAKGASGNVATEDVLYMLNGLGINTGVSLEKVIAAGLKISAVLGRETGSRVARARHCSAN